jgi:macrocin-O-methyltransferase TylF-like protien
MNYDELLNRYPIISDQVDRQGLRVILRELQHTLTQGVPGDIAEFGCYIGTTSLFIRRLLDEAQESSKRRFYAYDSFAGLPAKTAPDHSAAGTAFQGGALQVSKHEFLQAFHKAHLPPPIIYKAWFGELTASQLPDTLAFAFLDGDFYQSIFDSLRLVWPRLQSHGTLVIDDYQREALPGVTAAVRDFFGQLPAGLHYEHNIAVIKKS